MPYLETIYIAFYNVVHLHLIFFILLLQMSDAFYKSSFFLHYLITMYDSDQLKWLLVCCFIVCVSSLQIAIKTFCVLRRMLPSEFLYFLVIPLSPPSCR